MSIVITGATGHLGGSVINFLLKKVPADQIVAVVRNKEKAKEMFEDSGIEIRRGDYDEPQSLTEAFSGADKLLFISSPSYDDMERVVQHANVVKAARDAGVKQIHYTSYAYPEDSRLPLALLHLNTEYAIKVSGIPYTFIRNSLYTDVFVTSDLSSAVEYGALISNSGTGRLNTVTRNDLAKGTAEVLSTDGHENKIYNFVSSQTWSYEELAQILTNVTGKNVEYKSVSFDEEVDLLKQAGLPEGMAVFTASTFDAISKGETSKTSDDLKNFIGKETQLEDFVTEVLQKIDR